MKAEQIAKLVTPNIALAIAAVIVGLYLVKRTADGVGAVADKVGEAAAAAADAANPASQTNAVQRVGTAIVQALDPKAKEQGLTLSTKVVDWLGAWGVNSYDPNAPLNIGALQLRR